MAESPITQRAADEQITRLIVLVEGITAKVSAIPQMEIDIAVMKESFADKCKEIDKLDEIINGNGKPGMKDDVSHLKSHDKLIRWIGGIIVSSLLLSSVAMWLYLFVKFGQLALRY